MPLVMQAVIQMFTQLREECAQMPDAEPLVKALDNSAHFAHLHRQALVVTSAKCTARLCACCLCAGTLSSSGDVFPTGMLF